MVSSSGEMLSPKLDHKTKSHKVTTPKGKINKQSTLNSNRDLISIATKPDTIDKDRIQHLILKLEQIRQSAGAKNIDDI